MVEGAGSYMKVLSQSTFWIALLALVVFSAGTGCKDKRINSAPAEGRDITVEAPGADVHVGGEPATPVSPHGDEGVVVNVGPGGVQVDVEGTPLRDRLREQPSTR